MDKVLEFIRANSKTLSTSRDFWNRKYSRGPVVLPHGFAMWKDGNIVAFLGTLEDALPVDGHAHPIAWCVDWEASSEVPGAGAAVLDFAVRQYREVAFMTLGGRQAGRGVLEAMGWKAAASMGQFEMSLSWPHATRPARAAFRQRRIGGVRDIYRWSRTRGRVGRWFDGRTKVDLGSGDIRLTAQAHSAAWASFPAQNRSFGRDLERYRRQYFDGEKSLFSVSTAEVNGRDIGVMLWFCRRAGGYRVFHLIDWLGSLQPQVLKGVSLSAVNLARRLGCDSIQTAASDKTWHDALSSCGFRRFGAMDLYVEPRGAARLRDLEGLYLTQHDCDSSHTYLKSLYES